MKHPYRLFNWYFKRNALPYWVILILDCLIIYFSALFIFWVVHRGAALQHYFWALTNVMLVYIAVCVVFFKIYSTYSGIIRYSSFVDLQRVGYANLAAFTAIFFLHYLAYRWPSSVFYHLTTRHLLFIFLLATALMWAERVLVKILYDVVSDKGRSQKVFIYGVSDGAVALAKSIRTQRPIKFVLCGFISPQEEHSHHRLMGQKVYINHESLLPALNKDNISAVLVSPTRKREFRNDSELQDLLISNDIKIYMVDERVRETTNPTNMEEPMPLKEVSVEDLLPRQEIRVDLKSVEEQLKGKRVLITGSAGSIGMEIVRQVAVFKPEKMMLIDQAETPQHDVRLMMARDFPDVSCEVVVTSISRRTRMENIFSSFKPDFVFHAAGDCQQTGCKQC